MNVINSLSGDPAEGNHQSGPQSNQQWAPQCTRMAIYIHLVWYKFTLTLDYMCHFIKCAKYYFAPATCKCSNGSQVSSLKYLLTVLIGGFVICVERHLLNSTRFSVRFHRLFGFGYLALFRIFRDGGILFELHV